jgi:peptidoglycan L-alanyl-D-glutamate endopeptidase CwlK
MIKMALDVTSEARLAQVHPELARRVRQIYEELWKEGIVIHVIQGLRTYEEQDALYAKGRTAPGPIVTNARGGRSYHNYGLAVDLVPAITPDGVWTPDWKNRDAQHCLTPHYKRMIEVGTSLGLISGSRWVKLCDDPHFQFTGELPERAPSRQAEIVLRTKGLQAAWQFAGLDIRRV